MAAIGDKSHPIFIDACGQAQVCDSIAGGGGSTVVGSIVPYCGTDTPDGFFPCDGREISRESYADLYAVIGNTFGTPTDPTKFVLPKIDDARYLQGNTTPGQEKSEELPNITGTYESQTDYEITAADSITTSGALSETAKRNLTIVQPVTTIQLSTSGIKLDASKMSGSVYKDGGAVQPKSVTVRYLICWKKTIAKVDAMVGMPDYSKSAIVDKTESFEVSENGYLLIDLTHGSGWDTGNTGGEVEVGSYGIWNWSRGARASSGGSDWNDKQSCVVPVSKGDQVTIIQGDTNVATIHCKLIPCKIVQQTNDAPYVVERKRSTNTDGSTWWYTLWSDKWCEQGGCTPANTTSGKQLTVALPKPYDGTTYGCVVTQNNAPSDGLHPNKVLPSTDSFVISWTDAGTPRFTWHAEGYVA